MSNATNYGQLVIGPAGSGKTTYCRIMQEAGFSLQRQIRIINLDPAAEELNYSCDIDIRELISVENVMEEMDYGPNGALIFCIQYLMQNMTWLKDNIVTFPEDSYYLFDCPGQIELYSHLDLMKQFIDELKHFGFSLCSVYCLDSSFISEPYKYISASLVEQLFSSLSSMIQLEIPHLSLLTKCDKIKDKKLIEKFLELSTSQVLEESEASFGEKYKSLTQKIVDVLEDHLCVSYYGLDISDEESVQEILNQIDQIIQYSETLEPKEAMFNIPQAENMNI